MEAQFVARAQAAAILHLASLHAAVGRAYDDAAAYCVPVYRPCTDQFQREPMVVGVLATLVAQQAVAIVFVAQQQVYPAIVVKIGRGDTHCGANVAGATAGGNAAEGAVAVVVEQRVYRQPAMIHGGHDGQV